MNTTSAADGNVERIVRILCGALLVAMTCAGPGRGVEAESRMPADEPPVVEARGLADYHWRSGRLEAGATLLFEFPELPPTLHEMAKHETVVPAFSVRLPDNYSSDRKFPLLVFVEGGKGMRPGGQSKAVVIAEGRDFIAVSLPLFKKRPPDEREPYQGLMLGHEDFATIAHAYTMMLTALLRTVPNIDDGRGVLGGFSNGAHSTATLLSGMDGFILQHFDRFYLIEGGLDLTSLQKPPFREKKFLVLTGGAHKGDDLEWTENHLKLLRKTARDNHLDFTFETMPGIGHGFPVTQAPIVRKWLSGKPPAAAVSGESPTKVH